MSEINQSLNSAVTLTPKNVGLIVLTLLVMVGVVYAVYADSKKGFDERMAMYQPMSAEEMAVYLAEVNAEALKIDAVTKHAGSAVEGSMLISYREVSVPFFSSLIVDVDNIESEKNKMERQLKREMCGLPTYDLFYEKGGRMKFVYHLVEDDKENRFLFDVIIDTKACL